MRYCRLLKTEPVSLLADFGPQPICNRFLANLHDQEFLHPLLLGQCQTSGLVQLCDAVNSTELVPPYDWITYNEPEDHLDDLVEVICSLPGISKDSLFCGLTFKDDSTLKRLRERGFLRSWSVNPKEELGILNAGAGAETIQNRFTPETARGMVARRGERADVIIIRHILEHAFDTRAFIQAAKEMIVPGGYVVFEVPDCTRALDRLDYSTLWEEHLLYFTSETFRHSFSAGGLSLVSLTSYPYVFEDCLVGIARVDETITPGLPDREALERELERATTFADQLPKQRQKVDRYLSEARQAKGKVALFGAGHLACTFVNILQIGHHIDFVVDDNPRKTGLFMPGSGLPIKTSKCLLEDDIKLCLLSLNPFSEAKVITNNQHFVDKGGTFASIFPASTRWFLR
ncbi:MAG: methyltransferase domain-containing protein [Candidatus Omnitrophica bacterium]|nr:methyltransferase domain-containing protein [Candidatus Omnitrophota bacterium]